VALESGEVQYGTQYIVPLNDVARWRSCPSRRHHRRVRVQYLVNYFEFNLRRPALQDVRVRRAIAHANRQGFLVKMCGSATPRRQPRRSRQAGRIPHRRRAALSYDPKKAEALLDEAGAKRGADGVRLQAHARLQPERRHVPADRRLCEAGAGGDRHPGNHPQPGQPDLLRRVWGEYDFDLNIYSASNIADPVIGIQRCSPPRHPAGRAYTNGSGYSKPRWIG